MPAIQPTQHPSSIRPQDLFMVFLSQQTDLAIRLSQELQWMSEDLLKRTRRAAAERMPLDGPFSNITQQTVFQLAGAAGSAYLNVLATQMNFNGAITLDPTNKAGFEQQAGRTKVMAALFEQIAGGSMTYLKGTGNAQEFRQQELQQFEQQNASCQKSVRDAQDALLSAARQVTSHS